MQGNLKQKEQTGSQIMLQNHGNKHGLGMSCKLKSQRNKIP